MMSSFSGWHLMILVGPIVILAGVGFAAYSIARARRRRSGDL